jgi:hypothetical protein
MQLRMRLGAMAAAGSAAALLLAGGSAMASTHAAHSARVTGPEVVRHYGKDSYVDATRRDEPLPVKLWGVVNTHGIIDLGGYARTRSIFTPVGRFTLYALSEHIVSKVLSSSLCHLQDTVTDKLVVVGQKSTGVFAGASGYGKVVVRFRFYFPRSPNGSCDYSGPGLKRGGQISFLLVIPALTVW